MPIHNYQDFVIYTGAIANAGTDRKRRPKRFSLRVFDSPVGEGERDETIDVPDWNELETCRTALAGHRIPAKDFQAFARRLGKMILPEYARGLYYGSLSKIEEENNGLRIRLYLLPALACLPWEYALVQLHEGEATAQDFWGQDHRISIVRHEMIAVPAPPFRSTPQRRVIFAMASPPDAKYPPLNLRDEQKGIKEALNSVRGIEAEYHPDYAKEPRSTGTTVEAVEEALQNPADIFHFSGHGDYREAEPAAWGGRPGRGILVFDSGLHSAREVRADVISGVLAEGQVRLVVLDACETGQRDMFQRWSSVAMALLKKGIPAVVAMQFSIRDDTAQAFSKRIYEELVAGRTIDEAVAKGRLAISRIDGKMLDWGSPVLYMRNSGGIIFPPVTDARVRREAEESSQRESTLNETVMGWTRKGMFASADQLELLEQGGNSLNFAPPEAVLLLRSALVAGRETGYWVEQLRRVGGKWLEDISAAPLPQKEKGITLAHKCLGLDGRILPPPPQGISALAWAAVRHPDPMTSQTAALALLAQRNGQAIAEIQNALRGIAGGVRRRRRAMLVGALAESDPEIDKELPRIVDNLQDRCAVWGWRARKHLRANRPKIFRWTFGGALGGGLALALLRGISAFFSTHLPGPEFAIYSYWGFIAGWGLLLGTMLAAPLLLQDYGKLKPENWRRTAILAVFLGAAGFCLASTLTMLMNSYSFSLERMLRMIGTSFLVGGGLSLGLIGLPDAGMKLGAGG
ncbi:MAG: CHAT domain-containing protein [Anaerolineales bacterium]